MKNRLSPMILGAIFAPKIALAGTMIPPDDAYFERFKRDAPFVAVIEYVDAGYTRVTGQRTFRSQKPFKAGAGATIQLQGMNLNLYGLSACPSKRDISVYVYSGPCDQAAPQYINTELSLSPMLLCRVFESQADKPLQDATCFTLYRVLDTEIIHNLEDAVLRVGAVMLTRDKEGRPLRPDLETSEQFAREKQTLLWNPSAAAALGIHQ